jgi:hypothetical protein
MKIIRVDNFAREHIADQLIAENVNEYYGSQIVDFLNDTFSGEHSSDFYRLVKDDYILWRGMEELV